MSSGISFWKRVGSAFRASPDRGNGDGVVVAVEPAREDNGAAGNGVSSSVASLLPWVRRNRSLQKLDERYQRVVELLDTMRDHFERQDQRAEELTAGVGRLGNTLEQLVVTQRTQSDCIASIATRTDEAVRRSTGLVTMLHEMPASLQAQAEAVRSVARQMEANREADAQLVSSLRQFGQAADSLRDAGAVQTQTLQRLHTSGAKQEESLQTFVRSQTRLLLIITIIVAVLGLGSVAALSTVVHMVFNL